MTGRGYELPTTTVLASLATVVLALVATVVGLTVPGFYRDAPVLLPQVYGQDLLTLLVALPVLVVALALARKGSLRGYVVWLGVTGYLLYTYASYALMTAFNELYLVYTTLLWLTLAAFVGGLLRVDPGVLKAAMGDHPVGAYIAYQVLLAVLVGFLWLSDVVPAILAGGTPTALAGTDLPVNVIHSLDLGIILPAFLLTAYWLHRGEPWGYVLAGVLLVKGTTITLAVLSMVGLMVADGQAVPLAQVVIFAALSLVGLALVARFLRAIDSDRTVTEVRSEPAPAAFMR